MSLSRMGIVCHIRRLILFTVIVAFAPGAYAQLSGTYTVCSTGCNYNTIQKAANDLQAKGINGPVTIEIKPGNYNEKVAVDSIKGLSSTNILTFKGTGSKATDVRVYFTGAIVWNITKLRYITLDNIHIETKSTNGYAYALHIDSSANITVQNCRLTGYTSALSSYGTDPVNIWRDTNIVIRNNYIRGGLYGIHATPYEENKNIRIENNLITKWGSYGTVFGNCTGINLLGNTFDSSSSSNGTAIYFYQSPGTIFVKGNTIKKATKGITGLGIKEIITVDSNYITNSSTSEAINITGPKIFVTRNYITVSGGIGISAGSAGEIELINNMISGTGSGIKATPGTNRAIVKILHNTIYQTNSSSGYCITVDNFHRTRFISVQNNLLAGASAGYELKYMISGNVIDGNVMTKTGSGTYGTVNFGNSYNYSMLKADIIAATGTGNNEQNVAVTLAKTPTDLHLDQTKVAPYGNNIGVGTDIDGDARCTLFPTVGADETSNTSGSNFTAITGTKFTGPSKTYIGTPTRFLNSAPANSRYGYRWYINGKKVSDSFNLYTWQFSYPSACIKLEAYNCGSIDTFSMCITVDSPKVKPTANFTASKRLIKQGDTIQLTDASAGYASTWEWKITPLNGAWGGQIPDAYKYIYGDKNTPASRIRFDVPGKYKICLTASNLRGTSAELCREDYIEVLPAYTLQKGKQVAKAPEGYIYDNGGPWDHTFQTETKQPLPNLLIDACADSVYLTFKYFVTECKYDYVRIYEGKDSTGKLLTCNKNKYISWGPGLTGSSSTSCAQQCSPIRQGSPLGTFVYDTFKAAKNMYIEMESNSELASPGFEAYYWTKPASVTYPTAKFTAPDSVCTNGEIRFTNKSSGKDLSYYWSMDGNGDNIEDTAVNPVWHYSMPGKYRVKLFALNCGNTDTFSKVIKVFNPDFPVAKFTVDNPYPTPADMVYFSPDMPMCIDKYRWTITPSVGTGKAVYLKGTSSATPNPIVSFTDTGCYNVRLYVKNATGEDSVQLSCYIRVHKPYCTPSVQNKLSDIGISVVKFNTIDNPTQQAAVSYTSYVNDLKFSTTIEKGEKHSLTVGRFTNSNRISRTAWIDWNIDGDFNDSLEKIGEELNSLSLTWTLNNIKVPALAKVGATVLRVGVNLGSQTNSTCGPNAYGEYEDYRVYVRNDITAPNLKLNGNDSIAINQCEAYADMGATAVDNVNGDMTSKITVTVTPPYIEHKPGTFLWKYSVKDSAGNLSEKNRVLTVAKDTTPPEIILFSPDTLYADVFTGVTGSDSAVAYDCGHKDTLAVTHSGMVDIDSVGTYVITYYATDSAGNTGSRKRVVIVQDKTLPVLSLIGNDTVRVQAGYFYKDSGVNISDNYYPETVLRALLVTKNNVKVDSLGIYTVTYTLTDPSGNGPVSVTRIVIVEDTEVPMLTLIGTSPYHLEVKNTFVDPGIKIQDAFDKNLTTWKVSGTFYTAFPTGYASQIGSYTVIYTVTDHSGNTATITRDILVEDNTPPKVTLLGSPNTTLCRWQNYQDSGIDYSDNYYSNSSLTVQQEGSFLTYGTQVPGIWSLRYKVTDPSGNTGYSAWRNIGVLEANIGPCTSGMEVNGNAEESIVVYPNPTTGKFTIAINLPSQQELDITVTNALGQTVAKIEGGMLQQGLFNLDLSSQAGGVYMLNIYGTARVMTKRLIITR